MEELFGNNIIILFFFAAITIFEYSEMKGYQKLSIIYITVYALSVTKTVSPWMALVLLFVGLFCYLEILVKDEMKFRILTNPLYKCVDCLYLAFMQYGVGMLLVSILLTHEALEAWFLGGYWIVRVVSFFCMVMAITSALRQKFVIRSFDEMYRVFREYPIYEVKFNEKLEEACEILTKIEDREYYERKGYTFLSYDYLLSQLKQNLTYFKLVEKVRYTLYAGRKFVTNVLSGKRGYSTIPMQLIRSLGIERGYNCTYRRKLYEIMYSRMFFHGIQTMFKSEKIGRREHFKQYLLYIYFHTVNTFLGDASFSKFLNAFDMKYSDKNDLDIYDCSNEGIFIACMGLSKRAKNVNEYSVDYYTQEIDVSLDHQVICTMVETMMDRPFDGNYLK